MPITFEKIDDGPTKLIWITEIQKFLWVTASKPELLQRINFQPVIPDFAISCLSRLSNNSSTDDDVLTYTTELRLTRDKLKTTNHECAADNCEESLDGAADGDQQQHHLTLSTSVTLPCGIWASINGGEKSPLKESPPGLWKSEKFLMDFPPSVRKYRLSRLNCRIWIAFDTSISVSERNVLRDVIDMYVQQKHCDVFFCFQGDESVGGHAAILSARSRLFADMFQQMKVSERIHIQDVQLEIFKDLLHYLYSGRISTPLTELLARPLFVAADKYHVDDLKEECGGFLLGSIGMDNAIDLMIWAHMYSVDNLKEAALTFVVGHGEEICLSKEWEELTKNHPDLCVLATRRIIGKMSSH